MNDNSFMRGCLEQNILKIKRLKKLEIKKLKITKKINKKIRKKYCISKIIMI